jgi:type IV pilus assembly protein PilY1
MKKFLWVTFVTVSLFLGAASVHADDTELFTIRVPPDALIMFDLSTSMNSPPTGETMWASSCGTNPYYATSGPGHETACWGGGGGTSGYYWANANCDGPFYNSSGSGHTTNCSKLKVAKDAIFDILDDNNGGLLTKEDEDSLGIRMGYMRFRSCTIEDASVNYNAACNTLQRAFDFKYNDLYNVIKNETTGGMTPLASQLREGKKYLDDHKLGDPAKACRKKFLILITDGYDTLSCNGQSGVSADVSGSYGYKRRRATVAAVKEAVEAGYQVFVVGFGADMPQHDRYTLEWAAFKGGTNNPLVPDSGDTGAITFSSDPCEPFPSCTPDQATCTNAPNDPGYKPLSGYALLAQDAPGLTLALKAVFRTILERAFSFTAPSIPVVRLLNDDIVYISSFIPSDKPIWRGDIKAYELKADGTVDVDVNGYPVHPKWSALDKLDLKDPGTRQIYTYRQGSLKEFTSGNLSKEDLGVATDDERNALIDHIRGIDVYDVDGDTNTSEWRKYRMGDIYHSNAVIVGAPNASFEDQGFSGTGGSYDLNKNRTKTLIVGANDGMLHVFDANKDSGVGGGDEIRAFIPPSVLPNLKGIKTDWDQFKAAGLFPAANHRYFVDATPKVADVWFYSTDDDTTKEPGEWKTVLVSGLRKGGKTYFALDVTDAANTLGYLWEFPAPGDAATLAKMGQSWSEPAIGRVKIMVGGNLVERWVAVIGGGYSSDDSVGKCFFVIDIKTGGIIKEFSGLTGMTKSFAAPPKAVDFNADGYIDKVYIGDTGGQMWVFNVSSTDTASWTGYRLFLAQAFNPGKHPIFYQASVALDLKRTPWVYFGTADREAPRYINTFERFYAVKDDDPSSPYTEDPLFMKDVTLDNTFTPPTTQKGWFIKLSKSEKILARAQVFNHLLFFTTYSPSEDPEPCTVGGTARLYIIDYLSGGGALNVDEVSDLSGSGGTRSKIIGSGMASDPVITVKGGVASIIVGISSGEVFSQLAPIQSPPAGILYWRDVIN